MTNGIPAVSRVAKGIAVPNFKVSQYGSDTSGRPLLMTAYMHNWWEAVVADLGFRPTIVQGAFMSRVPGGGAAASAGYHDLGGCMDVRTWDLTADQLDRLIRVTRSRGGASWRRDESAAHGGMDSHCHITLGTDRPLSAGAAESWRSYLAGDNGLANNAPDYEWRPTPIITTPPEDDMPLNDADKQWIKDTVDKALADRTDLIAKATAKAVLNSDVVSKLDVSVREALRSAFNDSAAGKRKA